MRPSNRDNILEAAVRVILRDGLNGLTFDAVAAESGVTRGGMMYHFPSREALVLAVNEHLAQQWEQAMYQHLAQPLEHSSADERLTAYTYASAHSASRAELLFFLDSIKDPQLSEPWSKQIERWTSPAPQTDDDPNEIKRFIARLAADGLWVYESMSGKTMPEALRLRLAKQITQLFNDADTCQTQQPPSPDNAS